MTRVLLVNEWRALFRDGRGVMILVLGAVLAVVSSWTSASTDQRERHGQEAATESARDAWLEREADNPHSRAHYGDYVFRPSGPLAGLDSGLQMVTGRSVFLEGHRQNSAVHMPHREASSLLRFDRLEPATVLNLLVPLILVLAGFGTVASERESGRLRLLQIQGARPFQLLFAKALALWSVGATLAVLVIGTHVAVAEESASLPRTGLYLLLHCVALWLVAVLVACVSSSARRPGTAAGILLSLWVGGSIVLPRLAAISANAFLPLPDRDAFEAAMREDREKGLDGHNPRDERRIALEQKILDEHGVETKEELPINLDGLLMQADEEYGDQVWDQHFGELEQHLRKQSGFAGMFAFANPLLAVDRLSMALAGTDLNHHLAFLEQAEAHRRALIKSLNNEHAFGGSKTGDWSWKANDEFYASFNEFKFEPPELNGVLEQYTGELVALGAWLLVLMGLLRSSARRLERGGSL